VIHASPDAPAVNVKLDGLTAIAELDYAESSGYQLVSTGSADIAVEAIIAGGNTDVINVPDFPRAHQLARALRCISTGEYCLQVLLAPAGFSRC
jgi:hypothetical protein